MHLERERAFVCVGGEGEQGKKFEFRVRESTCMCEGGGLETKAVSTHLKRETCEAQTQGGAVPAVGGQMQSICRT